MAIIFYISSKTKRSLLSSENIYYLFSSLSYDEENKKILLKKLFTENGASIWVSYFLYELYTPRSRNNWENYITPEEKENYLLELLNNAVERHLTTTEIYEIYSNTKIYTNQSSILSDNPKALAILRNAFKLYPEEYLNSIIIRDEQTIEKKWGLYSLVFKLWNPIENFDNYLESLNSTLLIEEFKEFYTGWKNNNYESIRFEFKMIDKR